MSHSRRVISLPEFGSRPSPPRRERRNDLDRNEAAVLFCIMMTTLAFVISVVMLVLIYDKMNAIQQELLKLQLLVLAKPAATSVLPF